MIGLMEIGCYDQIMLHIHQPACCVHLSMLLTGIIIHVYNPDDLLMGTIISLPKDKHGNMCTSDNYRGIYLSMFMFLYN